MTFAFDKEMISKISTRAGDIQRSDAHSWIRSTNGDNRVTIKHDDECHQLDLRASSAQFFVVSSYLVESGIRHDTDSVCVYLIAGEQGYSRAEVVYICWLEVLGFNYYRADNSASSSTIHHLQTKNYRPYIPQSANLDWTPLPQWTRNHLHYQ
jgi:hypothetical protein